MKVYVKNNYFLIEDGGRLYEGLAKDVLVRRLEPDSTEFAFTNVNNYDSSKTHDISEIQNELGVVYTLSSFVDFFTLNTGESISSESSSNNGFALAELEVLKSDLVSISVALKAKSLIKFGQNNNISSGAPEMIWSTGGIEVLPTTNAINEIVSTDAGDNQLVKIEGHTISGNDLTFVVQTITLNGTTPVTLPTPLARSNRLENLGSTDFNGTVTVYESGADVHLTASVGNQSLKCATSVSSLDYWLITSVMGSVKRGNTAKVDFELQVRNEGSVFRTIYVFTLQSGEAKSLPFEEPLIIRPNSDVRVLGTSDTNNTLATFSIHGQLASIL